MNLDTPEYFDFDYSTFVDPKEETLFKAYHRDLEYHHNRFNLTVRDGIYVILENQMKTWRLMHSDHFSRGQAIDDFATDRSADDYFPNSNFLDPEFREDLYHKIFVYYWLKDLREKINDPTPKLEYKPPAGDMLPVLYKPKNSE